MHTARMVAAVCLLGLAAARLPTLTLEAGR
jgi:hypothetical protein